MLLERFVFEQVIGWMIASLEKIDSWAQSTKFLNSIRQSRVRKSRSKIDSLYPTSLNRKELMDHPVLVGWVFAAKVLESNQSVLLLVRPGDVLGSKQRIKGRVLCESAGEDRAFAESIHEERYQDVAAPRLLFPHEFGWVDGERSYRRKGRRRDT